MGTHRALLLAAALGLAGCAAGGTYYGIEASVRSAPPPRFVFYERPATITRFSGGVYVVDPGSYDCDMFQYDGRWYIYSAGFWYRSSRYDGPYVAIEYRSVPSRIIRVPEKYWRNHPHGGPPGQRKKRDRGWTS